jgi:enoyl-[acyl-carrier protein] reductase II
VAWGKVEAGQSAGLVQSIRPAAEVMQSLVDELAQAIARMQGMTA